MTKTNTPTIRTRGQLHPATPNPSCPPPRNASGSTIAFAARLPTRWPTNKPGSSGKTA